MFCVFLAISQLTNSIQIDDNYYLFDAAVEYLPRDLMFKWSFPAQDEVTFQFWIPHSDADFYGWAGIAIQDVRWPRDFFRGDYYIAVLDKENSQNIRMSDRYAQINGQAPTDVVWGCTDDILESWNEKTDYYLVIYWRRKLFTGDLQCDVALQVGKPFVVKWALGPFVDGYIERHHMRDMGFEYFVLAEFYLDNNEDERARYGPWFAVHPQDRNWLGDRSEQAEAADINLID